MSRADDRDDFDDRPRRRRDEYDDRPAKSGGGTMKVLAVVGGVLAVSILGCCGVGYYMFTKAKQGLENLGAAIGPQLAGDAFFAHLKADNTTAAYEATSAGYKGKTTKAQFDAFAAKHPILTKHADADATTPPNFTKPEPGKPVTLSYTLSATAPADDMDPDADPDPDADDPPTKKAPPTKKKSAPTGKATKPAPELKDATVTLTLVEENGAWKVDDIQVK